MFQQFSRRASWLTGALVGVVLAPSLARAADMPIAPPLGQIDEERVTFGTGWYLRGDAALANDIKLNVGGVTLPSGKEFFNSWSAGLGFGYKYNEWLRTDVTADYRAPRRFEGNTIAGVACQIGVSDPSTYGSPPVYAGCYDLLHARMTDVAVLFNGYIDIGTWAGITPYVGAGVGFNYVYQKATRNWFEGNSVAYAPTWTDKSGSYSAYWDQSRSTSSVEFAWAAMAGASYALTPHAAVDLGYRFIGLGDITTLGALNGVTRKYARAQELRIGLRYTPD